MTSQTSVGDTTRLAELQANSTDFASHVSEFRSPSEVLDGLHAIITKSLPLSVLGAVRFPSKPMDSDLRLGRSVFMHKDAPEGWFEENEALMRGKFRPILHLSMSSMAPHTWTEIMHMFEPIGVDRLVFDLALKYGIRDGLACPVGGRWAVWFWSRWELSTILTQQIRIMIFAAASFAAMRLEQLVGPDPNRIGSRSRLTPRELSVLRLMSMGGQSREVGEALGIGEETVRSHLKKAQSKLLARNRTHAACEAMRQSLIP